MATLKVALIGPRMSGKTRIANETAGIKIGENQTEPTEGVRILPITKVINAKSPDGGERQVKANIEIWDCSGDSKYENCWPAIMKDLNGIVVIFDPTSKTQANDVRIWCERFCLCANLKEGQAIIFAHGNLTAQHKPLVVKAGKRTVSMPIVNVNLLNPDGEEADDDQDITTSAESEFFTFMETCYGLHPDVSI